MTKKEEVVTRKRSINQNITVPNFLTCMRIVTVPFYAYYYMKNKLLTACILLVVNGLSDCFDGLIARKFNQVTEIGKMLDPLADKITQSVVALCIAIKYPEISLFLYLFLAKEVVMLFCGIFILGKHKKKPGASKWYGKVATILFYLSCGTIVLMNILSVEGSIFTTVSYTMLFITFVMMLYSFINYGLDYLKRIKSNDEDVKIDLQGEMKGKRITETTTTIDK